MINDAIVLLALSQVVCLGGLAYLYAKVQDLRREQPPARRIVSNRVRHIDPFAGSEPPQPTLTRRPDVPDAAELAARMAALGVDVPALARRMRRSEDEVRLLLRRQGVSR